MADTTDAEAKDAEQRDPDHQEETNQQETNQQEETDQREESDESSDGSNESDHGKIPHHVSAKDPDPEHALPDPRAQEKPSKLSTSGWLTVNSIVLAISGLALLDCGVAFQGSHPLNRGVLTALGLVQLGFALLTFLRKPWVRTAMLGVATLTLVVALISAKLAPNAVFIVIPLQIVIMLLMFRRPVLDDFDAPQE